MSRYKKFDRSRLRLLPLEKREHLLGPDSVLSLSSPAPAGIDPAIDEIARHILASRRRRAAVILMMGAHLLRSGAARMIIALVEQGFFTHIAMNGAGPIHDYEMALVGGTTESVARYIREGQFGLWRETGQLNEIIRRGAEADLGLGEAIGREISRGDFPYRDLSVLAACYERSVPVTVHVGIGYDIIHEHPNCSGPALGRTSYTDFLIFAETVRNLEGGVLLNFGSAVMAPEVYLKALAMARNVARQEGREIRDFTTAVFDLQELGEDLSAEPDREEPRYYFRPLKTILLRTVQDGGRSFYVCGRHRETFPALFHRLQAHPSTEAP